ncbi:hypothetical protein BJY27_007155 [Streptomyces rapamycinicus]|uniref:Uncharacterized protein n=1 Tax=Streptomyces rapamycinicus TaxID=1226757 RepID=A0ABR6LV30_9ACTN|nr:hypothetical protein [Streptomyces rapamycinicus]
MSLGAAWLGPATAPLGQWRGSVLCDQVVIVVVVVAYTVSGGLPSRPLPVTRGFAPDPGVRGEAPVEGRGG